MITAIFGIIIFGLVFTSILINGNGKVEYLDLTSLALVVGGSIGAGLMSINKNGVKELIHVLKETYFESDMDEYEVSKELEAISRQAASVRNISDLNHDSQIEFLNIGIRLLKSDVEENDMRSILTEYIIRKRSRVVRSSEFVRAFAKYPPAFGMIGTILGLIGLMAELSGSSGIETIGTQMALALITTLYGIIFANCILVPTAEMMVIKIQMKLRIMKMILDTLSMIAENRHDHVLVKEFLGKSIHENLLNVEKAA